MAEYREDQNGGYVGDTEGDRGCRYHAGHGENFLGEVQVEQVGGRRKGLGPKVGE